MTTKAVVALFKPEERSLIERRKQVERMANEIATHIKGGMQPRAVILCAGSRLAFALPETRNFHRLCSLRSSILVGVYDFEANPESLRNDLECALSEYFEGRLTSPDARLA